MREEVKKDFCKDCYTGRVGQIKVFNSRTLHFGYLNLVYAAHIDTMHRIYRWPKSIISPVPLITSCPSSKVLHALL